MIGRSSGVARPVSKVRVAAVAATVAVLAVVLPTAASAQDSGLYDDVPADGVHSSAIEALGRPGAFAGTLCGEDLFCPWEALTRADMAVWTVRVLDEANPPAVTATRFADVDGDGFHAAFVERLAELEVTQGCATDPLRYCPDRSVSRAEMASFLARAYDLPAADDAGFADVGSGGVHASNIDALAASGITVGCATDPLRFCPDRSVSRAEMASFLVRAYRWAAANAPAEPISSPLERCTNSYGRGRASVLTGYASPHPERDLFPGQGGFSVYEPVRGSSDVVDPRRLSCDEIMLWWDELRLAEGERIAGGVYPCEYAAAYEYWPLSVQSNGPALLVGCWPRVFQPGGLDSNGRLDDPGAERLRLWRMEGNVIFPPNHPVLVEALFGCYRDYLQGPPPGWSAGGEWPTVTFCNFLLGGFGNAVRDLGVAPECAAEMFAKQVEERKTRGIVVEDLPNKSRTGTFLEYAGDYSWAECPTGASRLIPAGASGWTERCEAVVDRSVGGATDEMAEVAGTDRAEVVKVVKAMFCVDGTRQTLFAEGPAYSKFRPDWNTPSGNDYYGFVYNWTPAEGSVCHGAAMLAAAQKAVQGSWMRIRYC